MKSNAKKLWKHLLTVLCLVPIMGISFVANAWTMTETSAPQEEGVHITKVQVKPVFNYESYDSFDKWAATQVKYPAGAKEKGLQGSVLAFYTIDSEGNVKDIKIMRGVDPLLDNEVIRVLESSPRWTPGKNDGKPVTVTNNVYRVNFKL